MPKLFKQSKHLKDIQMSYLDHFWVSSSFGLQFAKLSCYAFTHAIFPDCLITSTSDGISEMNTHLDKMKQDTEKRITATSIKNIKQKYSKYQ
tara:strand:+ start:25 stop:300 length:276 start_codon:yes stop_codon:yes gene_type:complete